MGAVEVPEEAWPLRPAVAGEALWPLMCEEAACGRAPTGGGETTKLGVGASEQKLPASAHAAAAERATERFEDSMLSPLMH
mmetsp:Transcript_30889/g.82268  ORF Transcript_30889/g.82268 Transcript_30889/m.82268 type:complete len:81 (+) Transcript_30889:1584-1826(+)